MDIIEIVVESIVDEYKESAVSFINDKDNVKIKSFAIINRKTF